jgi:hypothetical protein
MMLWGPAWNLSLIGFKLISPAWNLKLRFPFYSVLLPESATIRAVLGIWFQQRSFRCLHSICLYRFFRCRVSLSDLLDFVFVSFLFGRYFSFSGLCSCLLLGEIELQYAAVTDLNSNLCLMCSVCSSNVDMFSQFSVRHHLFQQHIIALVCVTIKQ